MAVREKYLTAVSTRGAPSALSLLAAAGAELDAVQTLMCSLPRDSLAPREHALIQGHWTADPEKS